MRLITVFAVALLAQSALAGDRPLEREAQYRSDWSGTYIGAFAGLGISSGRATLHEASGALLPTDVQYGLFPRSIRDRAHSGVIGAGAGVNFQSDALVTGVEADVGYAGASPHHSYSRIDNVPGSPFPGVSTNTSYSTDFGLLGTLRVRGGYAFGDTMVFGTAGLALGHVRNRVTLALPEIGYASPDWSGSATRAGYAVGFGGEHRVTPQVSVKLDVLYINLANHTVLGTDPAAFPGEAISYKFSNDIVVPRLTVSARF